MIIPFSARWRGLPGRSPPPAHLCRRGGGGSPRYFYILHDKVAKLTFPSCSNTVGWTFNVLAQCGQKFSCFGTMGRTNIDNFLLIVSKSWIKVSYKQCWAIFWFSPNIIKMYKGHSEPNMVMGHIFRFTCVCPESLVWATKII